MIGSHYDWVNNPLTVHCRARSRRLRTRLQAMALETLVASHPCRLGDFSYVTIKTGENY